MQNKIIVTTGYMGSGSSAVTDYLSEFLNINVKNGSYEYIFLHCPDGLFDLEDKLFLGNNAIRSDEAIHSFRKQMEFLYKKKNFWAGSYRKFISKNFMDYVEEFLAEITTAKMRDTYWYYQQMPVNFRIQLKCYIRRLIEAITFHKLNVPSPVRYNTMELAFPSRNEFYNASKKFIGMVLKDLSNSQEYMVMDQLLLPHNLYRLDHYFDNCKVIVVERDPRDVFFLNKYVWAPKNTAVPYPLNVELFCKYYIAMRENEILVSSDKIQRIHFEDLVYNYEETSSKIELFLGINEGNHIQKKKFFNPEISIKNTQLFSRCKEHYDEFAYIEKELQNYLYMFPFEIDINSSDCPF